MHDTALAIGRTFFARYLAGHVAPEILDVGGMDVNGSLRTVAPAGVRYLSVDMAPGPGVDRVLDDPHTFPFAAGAFDAVVSTSAFEHDGLFWLTFAEMCRVTRPGGYIYLNAPSNGAYHRYPVDCWRFYPDAGGALAAWAKRCGLEANLCESFLADADRDQWNDFVAVFRRGAPPDPGVRPLHETVPGENVHTGDGRILRQSDDVQSLRELKTLRGVLGFDPARPVSRPPRR